MIGVPLYATECVKVVVDYGTASDAPSGAPNTRCVTVPDDAVAADALKGRARYKGNFLCAIDGYPESGCGDEPPSPYWSFWVWKSGRWVYSSEGVATYPVGDTDGDGHPDPLGFRYHPVDAKAPPRAGAAYPTPKPTTKPTTAPPARTTTAPPAPTTFASSNLASSGTRTPGTTATPRATTSATATTAPPATAPGETPEQTDDPIPLTAPGNDGGGFPMGTVAGGALAAALLGAAAWRFRKAP